MSIVRDPGTVLRDPDTVRYELLGERGHTAHAEARAAKLLMSAGRRRLRSLPLRIREVQQRHRVRVHPPLRRRQTPEGFF